MSQGSTEVMGDGCVWGWSVTCKLQGLVVMWSSLPTGALATDWYSVTEMGGRGAKSLETGLSSWRISHSSLGPFSAVTVPPFSFHKLEAYVSGVLP